MLGELERSRVAVVVLVVAAGTSALVAWTAGLVVVAGGWVVPDWAVTGALLVAAGLVVVVRWRGRTPWPFRVVAVLTALATLLSGLGDTLATYTVLPPDGCRVVVRETSFLFAGSGDVFLTGPLGVGTRVGSYRTDDGYLPVASGDYSFRWESGTGRLGFAGRPGDPVLNLEIEPLRC
ncbi:hypothetical protein AB0A63_10160 [Lentzea sp. NPDC042327]|uniref:hypothetical protein n=1 Tax=Lentzea sp. NPDC042327 TaxID=3154801 RepID=UPI0033DF8047